LKSLMAEVGGSRGATTRKPLKSLAEVGGSRAHIPFREYMTDPAGGGAVKGKERRPRADEKIVGYLPGWTLVARPHSSTAEWGSFRLIRTDKRFLKWAFYLGHNGERIARSTNAKELFDIAPNVYEWAERQMKRSRTNG
jgi:hypothetical protein